MRARIETLALAAGLLIRAAYGAACFAADFAARAVFRALAPRSSAHAR